MARKKQNVEADEPVEVTSEQPPVEETPEGASSDPSDYPWYDPEPEGPEPGGATYPEPEPEPVGDVPDFPLEEGHYFYTPVLSRRGHSEHRGVALVRERLGLEPVDSEVYDSDVMVAVQSFQKDIGEPMSGVMDAVTWNELFSR